jgi:hypothetical protein
VEAGVGVAVGVGFAVGVGVVLGLGAGVLLGVACAEPVGLGVGVPALAGADAIAEFEGASATDGCVVDPPALGRPRNSEEINKSTPPTPAQRTSRRSTMNGTPPTHY